MELKVTHRRLAGWLGGRADNRAPVPKGGFVTLCPRLELLRPGGEIKISAVRSRKSARGNRRRNVSVGCYEMP